MVKVKPDAAGLMFVWSDAMRDLYAVRLSLLGLIMLALCILFYALLAINNRRFYTERIYVYGEPSWTRSVNDKRTK